MLHKGWMDGSIQARIKGLLFHRRRRHFDILPPQNHFAYKIGFPCEKKMWEKKEEFCHFSFNKSAPARGVPQLLGRYSGLAERVTSLD